MARPFGSESTSRTANAPDIPTVDEAGVGGLYMAPWQGMWAPKGTPADIIARLNAAVVKTLADAAVRQKLAELRQKGQSARIPDGPTMSLGKEDARVPQLRRALNLPKGDNNRFDNAQTIPVTVGGGLVPFFGSSGNVPKDQAGWGALGHPEFGPFKLGKTNPNFSTSALSATIAQYYAATGKVRWTRQSKVAPLTLTAKACFPS